MGSVADRRQAGEITEEAYEREYAHNVTVLPRFGRSPIVPDVQHTLIHLAVLAAGVSCWLTFLMSDLGVGGG